MSEHSLVKKQEVTFTESISGWYFGFPSSSKCDNDADPSPSLIAVYICKQVAVQAGKVDKIRCLLMLGADARATDLNGNTYFHLAARDGRTEVLEAFIGDVDVTSANNDGDTALHLAAKSGHVDAVKLLLQKSKLDARNKYVELYAY